jgi:hypothetical protein
VLRPAERSETARNEDDVVEPRRDVLLQYRRIQRAPARPWRLESWRAINATSSSASDSQM